MVAVKYGMGRYLEGQRTRSAGYTYLRQEPTEVDERDDEFGRALAVVPGIWTDDLVIGGPAEDLPNAVDEDQSDTGIVFVTRPIVDNDRPWSGVYDSVNVDNAVLRLALNHDEANDVWMSLIVMEGAFTMTAWECVDPPDLSDLIPEGRLPAADAPESMSYEAGDVIFSDARFELERLDDDTFEGGVDVRYRMNIPMLNPTPAVAGLAVSGAASNPDEAGQYTQIDVVIEGLSVTFSVVVAAVGLNYTVTDEPCNGWTPDSIQFERVDI